MWHNIHFEIPSSEIVVAKYLSLLITLSSLIKVKQTSHANHTMRGLRYPRLILERLNVVLRSTMNTNGGTEN